MFPIGSRDSVSIGSSLTSQHVSRCLVWFVWAWILLVLAVAPVAQAAPQAVGGELDLRGWSPAAQEPVDLAGEWKLTWMQLEDPGAAPGPSTLPVVVPGAWTTVTDASGQALPGHGYATYHLTVHLDPDLDEPLALKLPTVNTAYRVYANGEDIGGAGVVGTTIEAMEPAYRPQILRLPSVQRVDLVFHVSNFRYRHGGLWLPIRLGGEGQLLDERRRNSDMDLALFAVIAFVALQHFVLFSLRTENRESLYFAAFCVTVAVYTVFNNEYIYLNHGWTVPWELVVKAANGSFYLSLPFAMMYLHALFPDECSRLVVRATQVISLVMVPLVLFAPARVHTLTVTPMLLVLASNAIYSVYVVLRATQHRRPGARVVLFGMVVLVGTVINDVLLNLGLIVTAYVTSFGTGGFIISQSFVIAQRAAWTYREVERLSDNLLVSNQHLQETNDAVQRFVPFEFLSLLLRDSIRDIKRGDHTQMTMGVLFCDLRAFTTLIEGMSPAEAFRFINRYLKAMEPVIANCGGFINQYLGDCIMALFPDGADGGVRAGIEMSRALEQFNVTQREHGRATIRIGLGLNTGPLMLGTIGGMNRLDSGVIGDPVNLAARLEGMTKMYGCVMLISQDTYDTLDDPAAFTLRELDLVVAKGKTEALRIYEVVDALPEQRREVVCANLADFAEGLAAYRAGRPGDAIVFFQACLERLPDDLASELYAARCRALIRDGVPDGWDGIAVLTHK